MLHLPSLLLVLFALTGSSVTTAIGTTETKNNLTLNVNESAGVKHVSLAGYSFLNYDKVSITADLTTDSSGNITSAENIKIVGVAAKLNQVTGVLTDKKADIFLKGKAIGVFNFEIKYKAGGK